MNQTEQFELTFNGPMPEWAGAICEGFVCESLRIEGEPTAPADVTYLKFNGTWFRLYFEFRCLFCRRFEGHCLPWTDDEPWTDYVDLADEFKFSGQRLVSFAANATAKGSMVTFVFESGLIVLINDSDDQASFEITGRLPTSRPDASGRVTTNIVT
jgi:hypothetical protein